MGKRKIDNYLIQYIERLNKDVKPEKVLLFGSYLKGTYKEGSDIDLIVVSNYFKNMDIDDRLKILYGKRILIPLDMHLHAFTAEEIKKVSPLTSLYEALKESKDILHS
ncbi:hypothetical protein A3D77_02115 [Candidatus Gottesmanbacteria bacterium RIFCSPHIGHO2_02_FULL_39_11]|uniref:Polymerase nucleotidyl transferase domain-containing protein n=1 Tax=Candidatus Gottesmanbacteria bacterium RIFCSPHIGHO2_02_FULL_39_11 TaxID=1798382 RepID=A0A1F5ZUC6_9BACT|nr:MAG: hypothetical protein A3D77_02115 [Candidatus Gottesmanbacteria bacterium RIFCSPHIGHO2_02_FULL_39_11]